MQKLFDFIKKLQPAWIALFVFQCVMLLFVVFGIIDTYVLGWITVIFEIITVPIVLYCLIMILIDKASNDLRYKKIFTWVYWLYFVLQAILWLIQYLIYGKYVGSSILVKIMSVLAAPAVVLAFPLTPILTFYVSIVVGIIIGAPILWGLFSVLISYIIKKLKK